MTETEKTKYSDAELQEFRELINEKIAKATEQLDLIKSAYKNVPMIHRQLLKLSMKEVR